MLKRLMIVSYLFFYSNFAMANGTCDIQAEAVIGILDFDVVGCVIEGDLEEKGGKLTGKFTASLDKLDTGVKLRNEHMHDKYLHTKKFPKATFILDPLNVGSDKFSGKMTLHGVTKSISGKVISSSSKSLKANFDLDITDYGIEKPGYKNIVVGQSLNITVSL